MTKYVKRVRVTQEFLVTCEANSSSPSYLDRDARNKIERPIADSRREEVIEEWREMSVVEQTLFATSVHNTRGFTGG